MSLASGARIGPYDIVAPLGAGGMGEVYRARDTRLDRDVAIKILPTAFSNDADRLMRFTREAKTLASLNHPHIAQIYGVEDNALVMELVEGEDLSARIARGPLGLADALAITRQIAGALEAAHDKGIVHRDLKPANVMLTAEGEVKVLDFGLAKAPDPGAGSHPDLMNSPTITSPATQLGTILGTAAYMAPEQAKGRAADKRSDVWALGCVLFEMVTGRRAFEGEDLSDTLAAVLRADPDWTALPPSTPAHVTAVIERCLTKDRKARIPDASVVRFLLEEGARFSGAAIGTSPDVVRPRLSIARRLAPFAVTALVAAAVVAAAGWPMLRGPELPRHPTRFRIEAQAMRPFGMSDGDRPITISRDGRSIAYTEVGTAPILAIRHIDRVETSTLGGTSGAVSPFFSPDGKWIGFFAGTNGLKKISVEGGLPATIATMSGQPRGASWGENGSIIFATTATDQGLMRVSAAGSTPESITKPDRAAGEVAHGYPSMLPGGRALIFTVVTRVGSENALHLAVLDLATMKWRMLLAGTQATYVGTGHLVYAAGGAIRAVPFDLDRLEVTGEPVTMVDGVPSSTAGAASYDVAENGTLVYLPADTVATQGARRSLVWVDRAGREEPTGAPLRAYFALRLSPDGTRVALDVRDQETDIWLWDIARRLLSRLTFDPGPDIFPVWMPDGKSIVFRSAREGPHALYRQAAAGTGTAERLSDGAQLHNPTSVTPDSTRVIFTASGEDEDILMVPLPPIGPALAAAPIVQTRFRERHGTVSPDGRWLAYESEEASEPRIYLRPFPAVDSGHWQVSPARGSKPVWSRDGRELFYIDGENALTSVSIGAGAAFEPGAPRKLFTTVPLPTLTSGTFYDVMPDGRRFMMIKDAPVSGAGPHLMVVLDWTSTIK
ncbi:MAG TPA: protein kinase [Vicinamibacterales bacterium]|nr:protein kinase [Vicinamibacterales bacterium]